MRTYFMTGEREHSDSLCRNRRRIGNSFHLLLIRGDVVGIEECTSIRLHLCILLLLPYSAQSQ